MRRRVPDISRANGLIGFAPKNTLEDILRDVVAYYRV
jgi:nucleoside-diphosphate-sugar epimerase